MNEVIVSYLKDYTEGIDIRKNLDFSRLFHNCRLNNFTTPSLAFARACPPSSRGQALAEAGDRLFPRLREDRLRAGGNPQRNRCLFCGFPPLPSRGTGSVRE